MATKKNQNPAIKVENSTKVEKFDLSKVKSSLLSNSFSKENDIYRKEIYNGIETDKQKGRFRAKIRRTLIDYMQGFITLQNDPAKCKELKKDFVNFYTSIYKVNDYSLSSVLAANASDKNKTLTLQGLEIAKNI